MTHEWITDRLPTEADAGRTGYVNVPDVPGDEPPDGWYQHHTLVVPGQPWWSEKAAKRAEVAAPAPAFAVGQQWRRRNGKVVTITQLDPGTTLPICTGESHWHWANGASCTGNSQYDLIELMSSPDPQPAPCLKSLTDDQLQTHSIAVQAEITRRAVARHLIDAKRPGGLLA